MKYETYERTLGNIEMKAPLESGVQALIYMLIFEQLKDKDLDVVIIDQMQNHSVFMSYGGISDLAIVDNEFNYYTSDRTKIKMCIELKEINISIKNNEQVKKQLLTYKKAIITNGKEWAFYDLGTDFNKFDEDINKVIELERELAGEKNDIRSLCIGRYYSVRKNKSTEVIDKKIKSLNESKNTLEEAIITLRKKIDDGIDYESIKPTELEITDDRSFDDVCTLINEFIV